jgi:hypothetical protein
MPTTADSQERKPRRRKRQLLLDLISIAVGNCLRYADVRRTEWGRAGIRARPDAAEYSEPPADAREQGHDARFGTELTHKGVWPAI